jgi:uncharacterized membrane protein (DUF4010 family)
MSKDKSQQILLIASGIILAEVSSLVIQIVVLTIIAPGVLSNLFLFLAMPAAVGALCAASIALFVQNPNSKQELDINIKNPISLKNTAGFALLISVGLILTALATRFFGEMGVYITSALAGAVSLRVVTFSVSELASSGEILIQTASFSILIAMMINMFMKLGIIYKAGGKRLCLLCALLFLIMLGSGVLIYFIDIELFISTYI